MGGEFSRRARISRPLRRITRRWALRPLRARARRRVTATSSEQGSDGVWLRLQLLLPGQCENRVIVLAIRRLLAWQLNAARQIREGLAKPVSPTSCMQV